MNIQCLSTSARAEVLDFLRACWGTTTMILRGRPLDLAQTECLAAYDDAGGLVGLATFRVLNSEDMELTSLNAKVENQGVGTALLRALEAHARRQNARRILVITTNDNLHALAFYQKRGYTLLRLYRNAMAEVRQLKPEVPELGENGIPLRDELELECLLRTPEPTKKGD